MKPCLRPHLSVIALSDNAKLRLDPLAGLGPRASSNPAATATNDAEPAPAVDEAESAMRRALGLLGESQRHRPDVERVEPAPRSTDRFGSSGLHRRRFVQDGDVPVTVLRRDGGQDAPANRLVPAATPTAPTSSRLQRTEAALAAETAARSLAERSLADAQAAVRDLQTKIGHAELAKNEAIDALRRDRDGMAGLRDQLQTATSDLSEAHQRIADMERQITHLEDQLAEERVARRNLEKSLRAAEAARDTAERLVQSLSEEADVAPAHRPTDRPVVADAPAPRRRGRPPVVRQPVLPELEAEPEPVKWWLSPAKPAAGRRR